MNTVLAAVAGLILGHVLDVFFDRLYTDAPLTGPVYRCPQCNRTLRKGNCRIHGDVEGKPDLRIKAVLDDGTGALTAILGREITERLLEKDLEACLAEAREKMDADVIQDQLSDRLLARPMQMRGNIVQDEFGLMLLGKEASFLEHEVKEEAERLLDELEELEG